MLPVRKDRAGSSSGGYEWKNDGDIVEVDEQHAADLMRIPHGGFSIVFPDEPDDEEGQADEAVAPAPIPDAALNPVATPAPAAEVPAAAKAQADAIPDAAKAKPAASARAKAKAEA